MGITGHKERALQRRGYQIQEALQRRNTINEVAHLRRGLVEDFSSEDEKVLTVVGMLNDFCRQDKGVYCELISLLNDSIPKTGLELNRAVYNIYMFYRDRITTNNRTLFKKTMEVLLKNENPTVSIKLIDAYLLDGDIDINDKVSKLRGYIKSNGEVDEHKLEGFLKAARSIEYSKYEESFEGDDFDLVRGYIEFSHGHFKENGKQESFYRVVANVLNLRYGSISDGIEMVVNTAVKSILNTETMEMIDKADLVVKNDLLVGNEVILNKGDKAEVKKMDYNKDSYFSEFFAIYKNPDKFTEYENDPIFKEIYNTIINNIYLRLRVEGKGLLTKIKSSFDAIIYENNLIVLTKDIELYWSNKGQRGCDDKRLTIRYRLNKPKIQAYVYTKNSNQLKPKEINFNVGNQVIC
jgi:hypothetical protein